jgi:hypothetical protein
MLPWYNDVGEKLYLLVGIIIYINQSINQSILFCIKIICMTITES